MSATTMTSREFNQDAGGAKKAARGGPVFITDRGRPSHVLLSIDEYERLTGGGADLVALLAAPGTEDIAYAPPRFDDAPRTVDFD